MYIDLKLHFLLNVVSPVVHGILYRMQRDIGIEEEENESMKEKWPMV